MTKRLPVVLESLRIATPCNADWDEMSGDERVRFCGKCEKNVYDLSSMTRAEAEALVREREGRLCVRFYQRADGTVLTSDCPVGVQRRRLRQRAWATLSGMAASAMLVLGLASGRARADLTMRDGKKQGGRPQPVAVMGGPMASPRPEVLMGKIIPPRFKQVKMGEPMPMMGDIAVEEPVKK